MGTGLLPACFEILVAGVVLSASTDPVSQEVGAILGAQSSLIARERAVSALRTETSDAGVISAKASSPEGIIIIYTADSPPPIEIADAPDSTTVIEEVFDQGYLIETASPGQTMTRQGPALAIARLHPEFVVRLASAIWEARHGGLPAAGISSAYRPPAFGVGGFSDKFKSLHTYGLAVDMNGIGSPGSAEAMLWHQIAAKHGVICPYGPYHRTEWNHCKATRFKIILAENPLRETVTADGPLSLDEMFEAGNLFLDGKEVVPTYGINLPAPTAPRPATGLIPRTTSQPQTAELRTIAARRRARMQHSTAKGPRIIVEEKLGRLRGPWRGVIRIGKQRTFARSLLTNLHAKPSKKSYRRIAGSVYEMTESPLING